MASHTAPLAVSVEIMAERVHLSTGQAVHAAI